VSAAKFAESVCYRLQSPDCSLNIDANDRKPPQIDNGIISRCTVCFYPLFVKKKHAIADRKSTVRGHSSHTQGSNGFSVTRQLQSAEVDYAVIFVQKKI